MVATVAMAVVAIPFLLLGDSLDGWGERLAPASLSNTALLMLVAAALACDVLLPVPSGPLLTIAAAQCGIAGATFAGGVGLSLGALVGYALGRWGGRPIAVRIVSPGSLDPKVLRSTSNGALMLFATRPIPIVAESTVLVAGLMAMPLRHFVPPLVAGNFAFALLMASLGGVASEREGIFVAVYFSAAIPWAFSGWIRLGSERRTEEDATR